MESLHIQPARYVHPGASQVSHDALRLTTRHGTAVIALHGAHLLSWQPADQREVLWVSPQSQPEPAAIRGGVPVCWPWFAKQGQAPSAAQHGPVRNLRWQVSAVHAASSDGISLSLVPALQQQVLEKGQPLADGVPLGLTLRMDLHLGSTLRQSLHTENLSKSAFPLTQALHSYYAVSHAKRVSIDGLQGLPYADKLRDMSTHLQEHAFALDQACDRIYLHPASGDPSSASRRYVIRDAEWQRRIEIEVQGSRSVVVWNPGAETARNMADLPDEGWPEFFCVEAANAGADVITLPAGGTHSLTQVLSVHAL